MGNSSPNDDNESPPAEGTESAKAEASAQSVRKPARLRKWLVMGGVGIVVIPALCFAL